MVEGDARSAAPCYARAVGGLPPCAGLQRQGARCRRGGGAVESRENLDRPVNLSVSL